MKRTTAITITVILFLGLFVSYGLGQERRSRRRRPAASTPDAAAATTESAAKEKEAETTSPAEQTDESRDKTDSEKPTEDKAKSKPKEPEGVSVAFKDMNIDKIAEFLSKNLKKPVIPSVSLKDTKITIVSKEKMPVEKAVRLVRKALLAQGIMVQEQTDLIYVRPISEVMQSALLRVPANESVSTVEDQLQIVTKEFLIKHYDVSKMVAVIGPMLPDFAKTAADPDTSKLWVTDTVGNLLRIEHVVAGMDVPSAEQTVTEIIQLEHEDAADIISIVRYLIAGTMRTDVKAITTSGEEAKKEAPPAPEPRRGRRPEPSPPSVTGVKGAETGVIQPSKTPVTLVPHISRNWIIAVAPAEIMPQIIEWIKQLDKPREVDKDYEEYDVEFAEVAELAQQVQQALQDMPGIDAHVVPFGQSKKLIVYGSKRGRELAIELLHKIDQTDAKKRTREMFSLKHADAEEMAERIESLFSGQEVAYQSYWGTSYRRSSSDVPKVMVVPDTRRNTITVITDADTMEEIRALIIEEDTPIDPDKIGIETYELKYADPGEIRDLFTEMFSEREPRQAAWWQASGGDVKPVGRLLGQFMFQVMPSSNKLIVQTKSVANFQVIDDLIAKLDQPQRAGLPLLIELKYANAEDLCEQLNAMLAEPGTLAKIRRSEQGLSNYTNQSATSVASASSGSSNSPNNQADPGIIEFWWQPYRRPQNKMPTSNLIGKIRFVPVYRGNAVMVLAPAGFLDPIQELIEQMDQPGRQVIIHARIGEIQHDDQTTLGLRLASDPSILSAADSAVGGSIGVNFTDLVAGGTTTITAQTNLTLLLNLLVREFDMKILLSPSLTASDNEAAEFFDGQELSIINEFRGSSEGTSTVTDITDKRVGNLLRVRPHITSEGTVNLLINLEISRIVPGSSTPSGNPVFDRREVTTEVIVKNGQTIMLSGILRQEDFDDIRKVPLLGDLPLIGGLFRATDKGIRNRELVVFITPQVMTTPKDIDAQMENPLKTLKQVEESLNPDGAKP